MSAPERPTLLKRNAILAVSAAMRMSQAAAITAPAPATVPFSAATTGRAALANGQDEIAGESGELEQAVVVPREQRADDVLDVAAGAEGPPVAGDHDGADAGLGIERAEGVAQLGVDLEGERVEPLGPVERDGGHAGRGVRLIKEGLRGQGHGRSG